ncbi:MAG: Trk family potassium uptake protein [Clostridia bacterium]|nr:Trk family potassium uptake protein [Clostridia bacterium]
MPHRRRLTAPQTLALGFALIIFTGGCLLALPLSSQSGEPLPFLDALFTAASATCVTGLVVCDTGTRFTLFGQIVILLLIQIGGLGFMTFAIAFSMAAKRRIGLRERAFMMEAVSAGQLAGVVRLARRVLLGTLLIEGAGALLFSLRFVPAYGLARGLWYGLFHAVSAFCNAGFDLLGAEHEVYCSFVPHADDPVVLLTAAALILLGGIGFLVWDDWVEHRWKWKDYSLHSRVVLLSSALLTAGSTLLFLLLERDTVFAQMPLPTRLVHAFFQAVTPRTAGFNAIDLTALSEGGALLTMLLMLVGASTGSTGGGLKITTVVVLLAATAAHMRGREDVELGRRRIPHEVVYKAFCNTGWFLSFLLAVVFTLSALQPAIPLKDLFFECISAIATVGLSTGITRQLLPLSKALLILLMYSGRVGSMTVFMAVTKKKRGKLRYPEEQIIIG